MSDGGGGIIDPYPSTRCIVRPAEEGVRQGGVAAVNAGDRQCVLFAHEFIGSLLSLAGEVAVGELVAVKALVSTTVGSIEDGEGEARESSEMDFVRGKARGRADRIVVGVFDMG